MTWKFIGDAKGLEPVPGFPLECSDDEFEAALKAYGPKKDQEAVMLSGLYKHTEDKAPAPAAREE